MNKMLEKIIPILAGESGVFLDLRMGKGFDRNSFEELLADLKKLGEKYKSQNVIPKKLALLLTELTLSMHSASYLYNESEQAEIFEAADELSKTIVEILT